MAIHSASTLYNYIHFQGLPSKHVLIQLDFPIPVLHYKGGIKCLVVRSVNLLPGLRLWAVRYIVRIAVGLCLEVPLCQPHNCNQAVMRRLKSFSRSLGIVRIFE